METIQNTSILVHTVINAPIEKIWKCLITPEDIVKWNAASADWHTTSAVNDLQVGGKFSYRMEAKDGSFGFDFEGIYDSITPKELIEYTLGDNRKVKIELRKVGHAVKVEEVFEAENENPIELQRTGWQAILDNFKEHVEQIN